MFVWLLACQGSWSVCTVGVAGSWLWEGVCRGARGEMCTFVGAHMDRGIFQRAIRPLESNQFDSFNRGGLVLQRCPSTCELALLGEVVYVYVACVCACLCACIYVLWGAEDK